MCTRVTYLVLLYATGDGAVNDVDKGDGLGQVPHEPLCHLVALPDTRRVHDRNTLLQEMKVTFITDHTSDGYINCMKLFVNTDILVSNLDFK